MGIYALGKVEVRWVAETSFEATTKRVRYFDSGLSISVEEGGGILSHFTLSQSEMGIVGILKFVYQKMMGTKVVKLEEGNWRSVLCL